MILTGSAIIDAHERGLLSIAPFSPQCVQPNSYDFHLGDSLLYYTDDILDVRKPNNYRIIRIPMEGYVLQPGRIYLGNTHEIMGSDHYVPIIRGRSSVARLGLFVHVTADLIDLGSHNQWTLQLYPIQPIRIYSMMQIGQVTFWCITGDKSLYNGKYQGSKGPTPSLSYVDYETSHRQQESLCC